MDPLEIELRAATAAKKLPALLLAASNASGSHFFISLNFVLAQDMC